MSELKACPVSYKVTNVLEALVYAESGADARARVNRGEVEWTENAGEDGRVGGMRVRRYEEGA